MSPPGSGKVAPAVARKPPTKPTSKPGRSAIDIAIKPARIGTMRLNATPPMVLNQAATWLTEPKSAEPALPANVSIKNAIAIKIPPATTNGSMCDTPFMRCL